VEINEEEEDNFVKEQRKEQHASARNKNSAGSSDFSGSGKSTSRRSDVPLLGKMSAPRETSPEQQSLELIREESELKDDHRTKSISDASEISSNPSTNCLPQNLNQFSLLFSKSAKAEPSHSSHKKTSCYPRLTK
jgi:hypothetical protein